MLRETFAWPVRVYYEDTDAAGIVYHANYLRYMERARTEWLRALGFEQDRLAAEQGLIFVITHADVHYLRAARFNEELTVVSKLERLRRVSIEFAQHIDDAAGGAVCTARNTVACINATSFSPSRVPAHMMRVFQGVD